jgi:hypothetical protein
VISAQVEEDGGVQWRFCDASALSLEGRYRSRQWRGLAAGPVFFGMRCAIS